MNIQEKLYDYNTPLSNDDRCKIAEEVEQLLSQLESVANFLRGMQFDPRLSNEIKDALHQRITAIDVLTELQL